MSRNIEPTIQIARDAHNNRLQKVRDKPDPQPETSIFANGCFWG